MSTPLKTSTNIVIEGPDGSGKSSFAEYLSDYLAWPVVRASHNMTDEEFSNTVNKHLKLSSVIFDRHRCVSELIYSRFRRTLCRVTPYQIQRFYDQPLILVYSAASFPHVVKSYDSPEHLDMITFNQAEIARLYHEWAVHHADIIYRGNQMRTLRAIKGLLAS